jgi:hypothetical protein
MPLNTGSAIGSYTVTAQIGQGGMGEVYRARDTKLDRDVALKVLPQAFTDDPDRLARFEREAKVLISLNHPQESRDRLLKSRRSSCVASRGSDCLARRKSRHSKGRRARTIELASGSMGRMVIAVGFVAGIGTIVGCGTDRPPPDRPAVRTGIDRETPVDERPNSEIATPNQDTAQTSNNPFPSPISPADSARTVSFLEFASLPDTDGSAARMMILVDEPGTGRLFVNDMRGLLYSVSYDGQAVTRYLDLTDSTWALRSGFRASPSIPSTASPARRGLGSSTLTSTRATRHLHRTSRRTVEKTHTTPSCWSGRQRRQALSAMMAAHPAS